MTQDAFDDRYGAGAFEKMTRMLEQPCQTYAAIAAEFGVTRERVRQWHRRYLPEAPAGHERQRLCARLRRRRSLFADPLFRAFFQHARPVFSRGRIEPIRARHGYRRDAVLVDRQLVALRDASARTVAEAEQTFRYRGRARFVFVRCSGNEFLFLPARLTADRAAGVFRNTFAALTADPPGAGSAPPAHPEVPPPIQ